VTDSAERVRPLLRSRQIREFTDEPVSEADPVKRWPVA